MILLGAAALMLLVVGAAEQPRPNQAEAGEVAVRQQLIIRVSRGPRPTTPAGAEPVEWRESRGPRCVTTSHIAGATMIGPTSFDLVLRDNSRVRARMGRRCPALDYYYGFYVRPTEDGRICADRDVVRSRMGGECQIDEFRSLRPIRR